MKPTSGYNYYPLDSLRLAIPRRDSRPTRVASPANHHLSVSKSDGRLRRLTSQTADARWFIARVGEPTLQARNRQLIHAARCRRLTYSRKRAGSSVAKFAVTTSTIIILLWPRVTTPVNDGCLVKPTWLVNLPGRPAGHN